MEREEFLNYLCYKYLILNFSAEEIIGILDEAENPYEAFYETICSTYEVDEDFFIVDDEIINKTQTIINEYRFRDEYRKNNPNYDQMFNDVIIYLNEMKTLASKNKKELLATYSKNEMLKRKIVVRDIDTLLAIIASDYEVYRGIEDNDANAFVEVFLGQVTHYFLESCPAMYDDETLYNNTISILKTINQKELSQKQRNYQKKLLKRMINLKE